MKIVSGSRQLSEKISRAVMTIGNFDGVHHGHRKIIGLAVEKARARSGTAVAYTFRPHPRAFLRPEERLDLLTTYDEKKALISSLGVDIMIEEPFSRDFSTMTAERFFNEVIVGRIGAESVVVGYDFSFGKDREGQLAILEDLARQAGIELTIVEQQKLPEGVISSSRIREVLKTGRVDIAAKLLGREFSYTGVVTQGEGRGRKLGFPTANIKVEDKLSLPRGVYATRAVVEGWTYPSVTNIGVRPTFRAEGQSELPELVETHLIGVSLDLYGKELEVRFVAKIRDEKKFPGIEALKNQIAADTTEAQRLLS